MEKEIKKFCIENSKKEKIDFSIFQNPINHYNKYGNNYSFNKFKGDIFEILLSELFLGNGYLVNRVGESGNDGGCDLIIKHPKDNSIRFILQAKNWNKTIDKYDIKKEFSKFQDNYKKQNNLSNSHFCFVSWKYVKGIKTKINTELNINVWDEHDIINNLFRNYHKLHPKTPSIILEPYQKIAFKKIKSYWSDNKRCYVEHSTGTGKTYIIAKLVEVLLLNAKNKILILSPSAYINDRINELLKTVIPSSNIAMKFKVAKIVNILTYQYLYHNSAIIPSNNFTHIIMDEAHRAGAPEWHEIGLLPIINNETKIVGLSATMQRYSSGIDIKEFLGNNCAGELSLFKAMALGILPSIGKYVYSVRDIDSKINEIKLEIKTKYKKFPEKKERVLSKLDAKQIKDYSIQNILYKYYSSIQYQKIIVFCEGIEHTIDTIALLEKTFIKFSNVMIDKITSWGSKKDNKYILNNFSSIKPNKNQINIIVAIDMLNEGIDVSGIDSIMLFRKTESPRVYLQQIGRALRKHGKDNPLIFDCVLNYQNVKINLHEESQKEIKRYRNSLDDFGLAEIEIPKTISIKDEVKGISKIIEEVEAKLNFYRSYENAKEAAQKIGIKSESKYRIRYRKNPRLPSKPHNTYKNKGWTNWYNFLGTEMPNFYPTYNEAKNATQKLGIKSLIEYKQHYKENPKLPSQPDRTYKNNGWIDWNDYFGTKDISNYPTYEEAKNAVRTLSIKSYKSYKKRHNEDPRLPYNPQETYKNKGWVNFFEFLGINKIIIYPTYDEAKQAVLKLNITSEKEYRLGRKEDVRLPSTPARYYNNKGWIDNYDFFNKNRPDAYLTYDKAKKATRLLSVNTRKEYLEKYKDDPKLPSRPENVYKGIGWIDYYNFLEVPPLIFYETYEEAKKAVQETGIKSRKEYIEQKRYRADPKLPSQPDKYYKNKGWTKWDEFIIIYYLSYEEAREAVQGLEIKTRTDYLKYKRYKEDTLLPSNPEKTFRNKGWTNWYNFLGTKAPNIYTTYQEAKMAVQRLNIQSMKEYKSRRSEDPRLPSSPSESYRNKGWKTFYDLCNVKKPEYYTTYQEAQKAAQSLGIKNRHHYHDKKKYKKDPKLPSSPDKLYKSKGWKDWYYFLGTVPVDIYPTYEEAKQAVQKLGIKSGVKYKKLYKKDPRLPSTPAMKYENKGWIDFYDFFGIEAPNKYSTYEEAKNAAHKLKIKSRKEYHLHKRYLEDLGLTCNPERKFKNKGWISWEDFLGC
ncbi:MAG: DEAD/DEAH box helicase family protein [Bacteroidales bacterium]|nr:DEAD/DEAH box helicase family protein [Bacteroidales bacterium]